MGFFPRAVLSGARREFKALTNGKFRRAQLDDVHLRLLVSFVLSPRSNCIDVGSHQGAFLAEAVRVAPLGSHIAYEPLPAFCERLRSRFPQVDVRQAALSSRNGKAEFVVVQNLPAYSGLQERRYPKRVELTKVQVETHRLDDYLPPAYRPDLIKVDVEGAEHMVFEGALQTLCRWKPIVVFEHGRGAADCYGSDPVHVFSLLHEAGLRIFNLDGDGPYSVAQFQDIFNSNAYWNFVAHP